MIKPFLRLLTLTVLPIVLILFFEPLNPFKYIQKLTIKSYLTHHYNVTYFLLEEELSNHPQSTWQGIVKNLAPLFPYQLSLASLESSITKYGNKQDLIRGNFVLSDKQQQLVLLRKIRNSEWVIELNMDDTQQEQLFNRAIGSISMIHNYMLTNDLESIDRKIEKLSSHSILPIEKIARESINITKNEQQELNKGSYIWRYNTDNTITFFLPLKTTKILLKVGPSQSDKNLLAIILPAFVVIISSIISITLWYWLYPLWRDLKKLDFVAQQFGNGKLDTRATVSKYTIASSLGTSFNNMAESIQSLISSQRQLTNAIAHDLRTPIARVKFALEMQQDSDIEPHKKQHYERVVNKSLESMEQMINQLLIHARYSRASDHATFCLTNLSDIVTDIIDSFPKQHKTIQLSCEASSNVNCLLDPGAVKRALENLMSNAIKYSISKVDIHVSIDADYCQIKVEDDGPGIKNSDYKHLFEPFAQLDNPHRDSSSGYGLGLAIVKQIAQWHKGVVEVSESKLGGACFTLRWPLTIPKG